MSLSGFLIYFLSFMNDHFYMVSSYSYLHSSDLQGLSSLHLDLPLSAKNQEAGTSFAISHPSMSQAGDAQTLLGACVG